MKLVVLLCCALLAPSHAVLSRPAVLTTRRCPHSTPSVPTMSAVDRGEAGVLRRVVSGLRNALFVGVASVLVRTPDAPQAMAIKAPPTPTKPASEANTKLATAAMTIGLGGGFVYWSIKEAEEDDEEEQQRIKDENERLEQMAKEYTDIDEGVTVDEDLFASLRGRLNSTETITGSEADEGPTGLGDAPARGRAARRGAADGERGGH